MVGTQELPRRAVRAAQMLGVALCYFGAGWIGLHRQLVVEGAVVSPWWPPTGIAVACLLILGLRCWPGIALGAFLVVASINPPDIGTAGIVLGNTAAPVCAFLMLRKAGFRTDLGRLRDGLALVFLGALAAMLLSASIGTAVLVLTGKADPQDVWHVWLAWWVGDAVGVLLGTPTLLLLRRMQWPPPMTRWKEASGLAVVAVVVVLLSMYSPVSALFLVYPFLIWLALRFQLAGSMLCALFASVVATIAATNHAGPFARLSPVQAMIKLQTFNGTMALTALLLSAVITEQHHTRRSVEQACQELVEVLEHLTAGDAPPHRGPAGADPES